MIVFRILMTEGYSTVENMIKYYGVIENGRIVRYGAQMPFNFLLLSNTWMGTKAYGYKNEIESWLSRMPSGKGIEANWLVRFQIWKKVAKFNVSTFQFNIVISAWKPR